MRDITEVGRLDQMPRLLRAAAVQAAQLTNFAALAASLRIDEKTRDAISACSGNCSCCGSSNPGTATS